MWAAVAVSVRYSHCGKMSVGSCCCQCSLFTLWQHECGQLLLSVFVTHIVATLAWAAVAVSVRYSHCGKMSVGSCCCQCSFTHIVATLVWAAVAVSVRYSHRGNMSVGSCLMILFI